MHKNSFSIKSEEKIEIIDITDKVSEIVKESKISNGFVFVYTGHVTACLSINENDPELLEDIKENLLSIAPIKGNYKHNEKYSSIPNEQNAHAHIISTMIKPFLLVPIENNELKLGTWQSLFFIELDGPRQRNIYVQVWGEENG